MIFVDESGLEKRYRGVGWRSSISAMVVRGVAGLVASGDPLLLLRWKIVLLKKRYVCSRIHMIMCQGKTCSTRINYRSLVIPWPTIVKSCLWPAGWPTFVRLPRHANNICSESSLKGRWWPWRSNWIAFAYHLYRRPSCPFPFPLPLPLPAPNPVAPLLFTPPPTHQPPGLTQNK